MTKRRLSKTWLIIALALIQGSESVIFATFRTPGSDMLVVREAVAPGYPLLALNSGTTGEVTVRVVINAKGDVSSVKIIDGHRLLREACKEAAMQWKFTAVKEEGQTERSIELKFVFFIASKDTATAKLRTVFKPPNRIEITRRIPQS